MTDDDYCLAMDVTTSRSGAETRVRITGEIDSETAPRLEQEFQALRDAGATQIVVDGSGIAFLSSAGLSVLITAHRSVESFRLERGNRIIDRLIALTGLELLYGETPAEASPPRQTQTRV